MVRILAVAFLGFVGSLGFAETLVADAKVAQKTERGFVLMVGTEPLAVEDTPSTRIWLSKKPADRDGVAQGLEAKARLNVSTDPPTLRELADKESATWLDNIRKNFVKGTVGKLDAKYLTVKFEDGSSFAYRATDKSTVTLKEQASAKLSELKEGQVVWAKGRLLPALDTWLVEVRDTPPPTTTSKKTPTAPKVKVAPLPVSGTVSGTVKATNPSVRMIDLDLGGRLLHFVCNATTNITLDGQKVGLNSAAAGQKAQITYKRDAQGRLLAMRVDLRSP